MTQITSIILFFLLTPFFIYFIIRKYVGVAENVFMMWFMGFFVLAISLIGCFLIYVMVENITGLVDLITKQ